MTVSAQAEARPGVSLHAGRWLRRLPLVLWTLALVALPVTFVLDRGGWDVAIYWKAVAAVRAGHDPYAAATAVQLAVHSKTPSQPSLHGPFSYVYSPITLPLLHVAGALPHWLNALAYTCLYLLGTLAAVWGTFQAVEPEERTLFRSLAPLAMFFPGLLATDIVVSGNIAYLLYGATLVAVWFALRSGRWLPFYAVVLAASCFKVPLLSLVALPLLFARRQWVWSVLTAVCGVALFAGQSDWYGPLFKNYLQAVELQFSINRDFGFSPAGIVSGLLYDHHVPYSPAALVFYLGYALPLLACLWLLSQRYRAGDFPLTRWFPVALVGVVLLNPRLLEYDAAPLALPLALILWRALTRFARRRRTLLFAVGLLGLTLIAVTSWNVWKLTECGVLVLLFPLGALMLFRPAPKSPDDAAFARGGEADRRRDVLLPSA